MSNGDQLLPETFERKKSGILQKEIDDFNDIASQLTNDVKVVQIEELTPVKEISIEIKPNPQIQETIINSEKQEMKEEVKKEAKEDEKKEPVNKEEERIHIYVEHPPEDHRTKEEIKIEEKIEEKQEEKEEEIEGDYDRSLPLHTSITQPLLLLRLVTGEKKDSLPTEELLREKFKKREKIDLNQLDKEGNTALHIAVQKKEQTSVQILILSGCELNIQNNDKDTPLLIAVRNNFTLICNILCNAGANIDICDKDGQLPIQLGVKHISETDIGDICQPLISKGADVSYLYKRAIVRKIDPNQFDEFGFLKEDEQKMKDYVASLKIEGVKKQFEKYEKTRHDLKTKESYRVKKFDKMIKGSKYGSLDRKLKSRVIKGVPYACRGGIYKVLLPIDNLKKKNQGVYQSLLEKKGKHDVLFQIDKDVKRCYQTHKEFKQRFGTYQIKLFNVLKAYSLLNIEVEYCQGMSTIAAILLMFLEEEDAFWGFVHLLAHPDYLIGDLYLPGFPVLLEWYFVFEKLFQESSPKLFKHIDDEGLFTDLYARKWVLCCLLECLPFDVTLRIFDLIVSEGTKIVFNIVLGIMKMYEPLLMKMNMEKIKIFFQDLFLYPIDADELIKFATSQKVTKKAILKYKAEYVHHEAERKRQHREREWKRKEEMEKIQKALGTEKK